MFACTKKKTTAVLKSVLLLLVISAACGLAGALFSSCISWVSAWRKENGFFLLLMPIAGLLVVWLDRLLKTGGMNAAFALSCSRKNELPSPLLTPSAFGGTILSHLTGASVGREGAALQVGGGLAALFCRLFGTSAEHCGVWVSCGLAGAFSAMFGTPLAAAAFVIELTVIRYRSWKTVLPITVASVLSYTTAMLVGGHAERFSMVGLPPFSFKALGITLIIALAAALLGIAECAVFHSAKQTAKRWVPNPYIRVAVGGVLLIALTMLVGNQRYNGAGTDVIAAVFEQGAVQPFDFALKLLFTALAAAAGYRGGEIVPSLFIGATFGGFAAVLFGLSPALGAAIGLAALFCTASNCPLAAFFLATELFSWQGLAYLIPTVLISTAVCLFVIRKFHIKCLF